MERSLNEQLDGVREAFYRFCMTLTPAMPMDSMGGCFVEDVFQDYLIAEVGEKYYRVTYSTTGETYTFAPQEQWQEVEETWIVKTLGKTIAELKAGRRNNSRDQSRLQQIHDYAVENGAMCKNGKALDFEEVLVYYGGEVKALGDGKVGGVLIRHSTENDPDVTDDYFDTKTDIYFPDSLPVMYQHGMDTKMGKRIIGTSKPKRDDVGVWVEAQLNLRDEYEKAIYALAEAGKLGWSSGAVSHLVEREMSEGGKAYHIKSWFVGEASLTPTPAEPRNSAVSLKSWIASNVQPSGEEPTSTAADVVKTVPESINEVDMEKEEFKALLEENNKSIEAKAKEAAKAAVTEVLDGLPEVKARMGAQTHVTVDEADRPFKSIGEQALAIRDLAKGQTDPRMKRIQYLSRIWLDGNKDNFGPGVNVDEKKALLGSNEIIPSQGEFLLDPTISNEFLKPVHEAGPITSRAKKMPVGPNSKSGWINGVEETSRADGSRWGGVRGYWFNAGDSMTASQPKFRRINWELNPVTVLQYATDFMLRDSQLLDSVIRQSSMEEINFKVNDACFRGTGAGQPKGLGTAATNPALISAVRTDATNIDHADITRMVARIHARSHSSMVWLANPDTMPEIDTLNFTAGTTGILSPYVTYTADGVTMLRGRPIVYNEFNPTLGSVGDLLLWDPNDYLFWEGSMEGASSIHVQFLTNQTVFRWIYYCDGMPAEYSALTRYQSTDTVSSYVALAATT